MTDDERSPNEPAFKTPEEVAAAEDLATPNAALPEPAPEPARGWRARFGWLRKPQTKREWVIAAVVVLVIIGLGAVAYAHFHKQAPVVYKPVVVKPVAPQDKTVPSPLSGLKTDPELAKRPVTAVMIENSTFARPQSGLSEAGVVFEAIAEGGITRFLALYQETSPEVGPVRSARPYYVEWERGFDAGYAHVGGSPEALIDIRTWRVKDLDQFFNAAAYRRDSHRDAPHNVYTNIPTLISLQNSKGYTSSTFTSLPRKKDVPTKVPTAKTIDLAISGPDYNVHYDYDAKTNSYLRSMAGAPHIDANNNQQIHPKVVVALVMSYGLEPDDHHSAYGVIGSGQAFIFQDGTVTQGTWSKTDGPKQIILTNAANKPIKLNAGQTWFTAMASTGQVTYAP